LTQKFIYSKKDTIDKGYQLLDSKTTRIDPIDNQMKEVEFVYKFSEEKTKNQNPEPPIAQKPHQYNILLALEEPIILLAASESSLYLHVFDY
jgi:hypothetical protein